MKEHYSIRALNNSYSRRIVELILPIQQQEFGVAINVEHQPDLLDIEAHYQNQGGNFWGAFDGEELVGTIALLSIGHRAGAIRKMFVKKEYRGKDKGIGQQLLDHLLNYCRAERITDIYLGTVAQMHAAHRFYERNGFAGIDATALPPYLPRMVVDKVFYQLSLNQPK
jgi:ribosomal protein S18 acetylase RimI-like enzyme